MINKEVKEECDIYDLLLILGQEVASLKESECGNSGANWYDKFYRTVVHLRDNPPHHETK